MSCFPTDLRRSSSCETWDYFMRTHQAKLCLKRQIIVSLAVPSSVSSPALLKSDPQLRMKSQYQCQIWGSLIQHRNTDFDHWGNIIRPSDMFWDRISIFFSLSLEFQVKNDAKDFRILGLDSACVVLVLNFSLSRQGHTAKWITTCLRSLACS